MFEELQDEIDEKKDPLKYVDIVHERLKKLNLAIQMLGAPSYRSGSIPQFGLIMRGWVKWNKLSEYCIAGVRNKVLSLMYPEELLFQKNISEKKRQEILKTLPTRTMIDIWSLVRRLKTVLYLHPFADGQLVLARSYFGMDVLPSHATVIQSMTNQAGGRVTLEGLLDMQREQRGAND